MTASMTGIAPLVDYSALATNALRVAAFLALIPNIDTPNLGGTGAVSGGGYLDEMSPVAANQLRVEITALIAEVTAGIEDAAGIDDGDTIAITNSAGADSHNATAAVAGNALTSVKFASTIAMVDNGDTLAIHNSADGDSHNATVTVAAGVATKALLASTVAFVDHTDSVNVKNSAADVTKAATATVTAGALVSVSLASTVAMVANGDVVDGKTITVVAGNITTIV